MAKRLLVVTQHFWPENFRINDIVEGLTADGVQVDVLCGLPNYPDGIWYEGFTARGPLRQAHGGAQIYRSREVARRGNTSLRIFLNYVSWPLTAAAALRRLPGGYDAVLCYNTSPVLMCWPAILAARRFHAPLTVYVLDIWPENLYSVLPVKNRLLRKAAQAVSDALYRRADCLIAMSDALAGRLRARMQRLRGKRRPQRYPVIPQYCEDFYALPARDEALAALWAGRFTLLFAGNLSPAQGLDIVLQALAQAKAAGTAARLVLVGDGMSREELQRTAQQLGLQEDVVFYGRVPPQQVPALAGAVDALLVSLAASPDLGLTVPAKVASCMAMRRPLLASMDGEGAAAAAASGGALVSPAGDAAALAANLCRLAAADEAAREKMGKAAFAYYEAHYRRGLLLAQLKACLLP